MFLENHSSSEVFIILLLNTHVLLRYSSRSHYSFCHVPSAIFLLPWIMSCERSNEFAHVVHVRQTDSEDDRHLLSKRIRF